MSRENERSIKGGRTVACSRMTRLLLFLVLAAVSAGASGARAQGKPGPGLSVYLLTMGPGDLVWEKFGHNAIWIHDPVRGTDRAYDYGRFDFNQPGFLPRFLKGRWIYSMGSGNVHDYIWAYQQANREVTAQELNLTQQQARALQDFLELNDQPENREYRYDYYRDNCSTRLRNALDAVLGGQLRAPTRGKPTGTTYRWHSERLMVEDGLSYTGLLAGLGPAADRPISVWEEGFLPGKLQEHVRGITVRDASGRSVPLVRSERVLVTASRPPEPAAPPRWLWRYLLAGLLLGGTLVLLGWYSKRLRSARWSFALLGGLWTLVAGIGGLLLLLLWTATDHTIAYRNENLFQLSPLALPLVLLVPALALGTRWARRPAWWFALALAISSVLGFVLQALPGLDQANGGIIALALPANLALAWAVHRMNAAR